MKTVPLTAFPRTKTRRGGVKQLRTSGRVPAVIYGRQSKPQNLEVNKVEIENLGKDDMPVTVTMEEWMRRIKDMSKMGGGMDFYGSMPDQYKVAVNANHPLVTKLLSGEEEKQVNIAKQAFDLALLAQGMLRGSDLTKFVERSVGELAG